MPKITSKRKSRFALMDRALMADKRIKGHHKILYTLLCSLAESCDNVFPSYAWLAEQVGYDYNPSAEILDEVRAEANRERAMRKFIDTHLEPLEELGLVKRTHNVGGHCDFEVEEYYPEQKSTGSLNKKVQGGMNKKVQGPYILELEELEKEERERKPDDLTPSKMIQGRLMQTEHLTLNQMSKGLEQFATLLAGEGNHADNFNPDTRFVKFIQSIAWRLKKENSSTGVTIDEHTGELRRELILKTQPPDMTRSDFDQWCEQYETENPDKRVDRRYLYKPPEAEKSSILAMKSSLSAKYAYRP
jgi:hypothetical protein